MGGLGLLLGPMFAVLGRLGVFVGGPGPSWSHSLVLCWRSWIALGTHVGGLGCSWVLCWRSGAVLGRKMSRNMTTLKMCLFLERERDLPPQGGLGPPLVPLLAVLGGSWDLCCRSWGALGPMLPVLGRSWPSAGGPGQESRIRCVMNLYILFRPKSN